MKNREAAMDGALLCIRIGLGAVFIAHGAQKLFGAWGGLGMARFTAYLTELGIPLPQLMAYAAAITEFAGGILVLIGLFPRLAALGLAGVMAVAVLKVHLKDGFFGPNGFEYPLVLLLMALAIVIAGAGGIAAEKLKKQQGGGGPP